MIKKVVIEIQGKEIELTIQEYHDLVRDIHRISNISEYLGKLYNKNPNPHYTPYLDPIYGPTNKFTLLTSSDRSEVNNVQDMLDRLRGVQF